MGGYAKAVILIIILGFLVTFGIKNSQAVQLSYYFRSQGWNIPLYALVYGSVLIGVLAGVIMGLPKRISLRRQVKSLEKETRRLKEKLPEERRVEPSPAPTTADSV
jgi:uncharacterized integral membrane protein